MKKRIFTLALAIVMIVSLMPMTTKAADSDVIYTDTRGNKITIPGGADSCATRVVSFTPGESWTKDERAMNEQAVIGIPDYNKDDDTNYLCLGAKGSIVLEFSVDIVDSDGNDIYVFEVGNNVEATKVEVSNDLENWVYVGDVDGSLSGVDLNGKVPSGARYKYVRITDIKGSGGNWPGADIDAVAGLNNKLPIESSEWSSEDLYQAEMEGLIPDVLDEENLKKNITRAEFAAVCVKLYENLSGTEAIPAITNPFVDCTDVEVLKAYNIGAVNGTSSTTFDPDQLLNREQAASMLTRVFKRVTMPGWSRETDSQYSLSYTKPATFSDDAQISDWARDSVYFMVANGIIKGLGDNKVAPKNVTDKEIAEGYANATREQAIIIALRMVQNLK